MEEEPGKGRNQAGKGKKGRGALRRGSEGCLMRYKRAAPL